MIKNQSTQHRSADRSGLGGPLEPDGARGSVVIPQLVISAISGAIVGFLAAGNVSTSLVIFVSAVMGGGIGWGMRPLVAKALPPKPVSNDEQTSCAQFGRGSVKTVEKPAAVFGKRKKSVPPISFQNARLSDFGLELTEIFGDGNISRRGLSFVLKEEDGEPSLLVDDFGLITIDNKTGYLTCSIETPCSGTIISTAEKGQIIELLAYEAVRRCTCSSRRNPQVPCPRSLNRSQEFSQYQADTTGADKSW